MTHVLLDCYTPHGLQLYNHSFFSRTRKGWLLKETRLTVEIEDGCCGSTIRGEGGLTWTLMMGVGRLRH
jgi:hypothetical protein